MGKLLPLVISKKRKIILPPVQQTKQVDALPFKKRWPAILSYMVAHPDKTTAQVWHKWMRRIDDVFNLKQFQSKLKASGMDPRSVKRETSVKTQVSIALQSFAEVKKEHAELHQHKIHKKLNEIHDVVAEMPVGQENVENVLDLVGKLQKEGRIAYGIDDEKPINTKAVSLAVLIGYEPKPKVSEPPLIQLSE
jgi:hypothetical protein